MHLATQGVEQVGGLGEVDNLHVSVLVLTLELLLRRELTRVLVAQLQVTLETAGRVLGTLTIVTVGQRHDETRALHPLDLTRGDELIDDTLRVVGTAAVVMTSAPKTPATSPIRDTPPFVPRGTFLSVNEVMRRGSPEDRMPSSEEKVSAATAA